MPEPCQQAEIERNHCKKQSVKDDIAQDVMKGTHVELVVSLDYSAQQYRQLYSISTNKANDDG
jgi:hypothetical protein